MHKLKQMKLKPGCGGFYAMRPRISTDRAYSTAPAGPARGNFRNRPTS